MGWVRKRGHSYQGGYRDAAHVEHTKTFAKVGAARDWVANNEADLSRGQWYNPKDGQVTFAAFTDQWRRLQLHRDSTVAYLDSMLDRHVMPRIGDTAFAQLDADRMQMLVIALAKDLNASTVGNVMMWVGTICKAAVARRVVAHSPMVGVKLPAVIRQEVEPVPLPVLTALVSGFIPRYRGVPVLGLGSGLRLSEALGLSEDRVDWDNQEIRIDRQLLNRPHRALPGQRFALPGFGPPKNNLVRVIPLADATMAALRHQVDTWGLGPEGLIFSARPDRWHPDGPGGVLVHKTFCTAFANTARPLGFSAGQGLHRIRHTYASYLIAAGLSVKVVQKRLGHKSALVTLDVYGHLFDRAASDAATRQAVDAINAVALGPPADLVGAENIIALRPRRRA